MFRWFLYLFILTLALGGMTACGSPAVQVAMTSCPVSKLMPVVDVSPGMAAENAFRYNFGNEEGTLYTNLWPDSKVMFDPKGPGEIGKDGSLAMKFMWHRVNVEGQLVIEGRRLDAPAAPLRYKVLPYYGETGFQPSTIIFASEGCWEVTGKVGSQRLTFVTLAVKTAG